MRKIGSYSAGQVPTFDQLIGETTNSRKGALLQLSNVISAACNMYDLAVPNVHVLEPIEITGDDKAVLIEAFNNRTAGMNKLLAEMTATLEDVFTDLCPYCSLDTNPDLDHFLPKEIFPEFALHARNLIYICTTCNRSKSKYYKSAEADERLFIHPAFEPSQKQAVLEAQLRYRTGAIAASYGIADHPDLSEVERAQLERHFNRLGLAQRYGGRAQNTMTAIKKDLVGKGEAVVRRILEHKIEGSSSGEPINGWSPALYRAVASDMDSAVSWIMA